MNDGQARASKERVESSTSGKLGTFAGVFTPSILTILGIILFLRMGFVVGSAGLIRALIIIGIANAISVLTSISLSAVATNLRVKGGGDYYLISRTLGVQYGGALGLVLFLAQSVSIAFYVIGFGEVIKNISGIDRPYFGQAVAALAVTLLLVLAWLGANWATRFQYVVMAVLFAAIVAFFVGGLRAWSWEQLGDNLLPAGETPFWVVFAIFFPAVTGFTQGVSMSGDLRDPGRSLPRGTFAAVLLSMLIYLAVALVFAAALPGSELAGDFAAMGRVSAVSWLISAGVIAATLSSALASFLGAPRILQSLAQDRVFPLLEPFAKGHGANDNPRRGVLLAAAIAYGTIALGELNVIAPIVSMFFLISYGLLNYATYVEAHANSPSFRPRFRLFHERLSLLGCLACLGAMLAIQPAAGAIAVAVLFALHQYIARSVAVERWADSDRSHRLQRVRDDLHAIREQLEHPRDWRPVLLAFSDDGSRRLRLLRFASWLEGRSGFTTAVRIIEGEGRQAREARTRAEAELRKEIEKHGLQAFARAIVTGRARDAPSVLLQAHGLGAVRPNTVLLNWFDRPSSDDAVRLQQYGRNLRAALRFDCHVVLLAANEQDFFVLEKTAPRDRRIDVWYRDNATGDLSLLLAYLMTRTEEWEEAQIRLFVKSPAESAREQTLAQLREKLHRVRIEAEPIVVEETDPSTIVGHSASSAAVLLPFRLDENVPASALGGRLDDFSRELGIVAYVLGCQDIELDADPEAGRHGEIAEAVDAADRSAKLQRQTGQEAEQAAENVRELGIQLESARARDDDADELRSLEKAEREAREEAERLRRRAARAQAKADSASEAADSLTGREATEECEDGDAGKD